MKTKRIKRLFTAVLAAILTLISLFSCINGAQPKRGSDPLTDPDVVACRNAIAAFTDERFGGVTYSQMSTTDYAAPLSHPTVGQHPRLLVTKDTLNAVQAAMTAPENADRSNAVLQTANAFSSALLPEGEGENYDDAILGCIRSKAFLYLTTDELLRGYDAIRMIKEFLTTFRIENVSDPCRRYGEIMFTAALVYDWCNALLTPADKKQLILGVEHKLGGGMEVGFPPAKQGAVSGHGCERQILRDYLSFSLAIYDDEPTWYEYVGGRIFEEYLPVRNSYYEAGYYPQGISNYLAIRFTSDLWSAWLFSSATGAMPYQAEKMKQVMHSAYSHVTDGGTQVFEEGDDGGRSGREVLKQLALASTIAGYLFDDSVAMSWADFSGFAYFDSLYWIILRSKNTEGCAEQRYEGLDLLLYNGGWLGQIIAHSSWEADSASVLMKIGNRTSANHDHADAGSFQIYYKGVLAGDSGYYDKYDSSHHKNYHKATVAHNSIVLKKGSEVIGQKQPNETSTYTAWRTDAYKTGKTTGYACGYADEAKTKPTYAYIAGDIADAYVDTNLYLFKTGYLERCDRRMLTVYDTGSDKVPMLFFVYDNVIAKDSAYQKVFLLHTVTEPTISGDCVTVVNGGGKLVLQNVAGDCTIDKVGGAGNNYNVGGKQIATIKGDDGYWGRVEVATSAGSKNDVMLNVMYVCDAEESPQITATPITDSTAATGSVIGNTAAVFVDSAERATYEFSFTASGYESLNYYVSGVAAGEWIVSVGTFTQRVTATKSSGLLTFSAPAGRVTLTPAN